MSEVEAGIQGGGHSQRQVERQVGKRSKVRKEFGNRTLQRDKGLFPFKVGVYFSESRKKKKNKKKKKKKKEEKREEKKKDGCLRGVANRKMHPKHGGGDLSEGP